MSVLAAHRRLNAATTIADPVARAAAVGVAWDDLEAAKADVRVELDAVPDATWRAWIARGFAPTAKPAKPAVSAHARVAAQWGPGRRGRSRR